jgi:hypothetical protein
LAEKERYRSMISSQINECNSSGDGILSKQQSSSQPQDIQDLQSCQRIKRPLNAYNIFCKIHFEEVKEKNPNMSINELSKLMGEKWKQMSDQEKKVYYDKVENGQPRYKKPLNSYNLFCKKNFEALKKQYPNHSINVLSKIMGEKWKKLPAVEKQKYIEAAKKLSESQNMIDIQQSSLEYNTVVTSAVNTSSNVENNKTNITRKPSISSLEDEIESANDVSTFNFERSLSPFEYNSGMHQPIDLSFYQRPLTPTSLNTSSQQQSNRGHYSSLFSSLEFNSSFFS